LDCLTIQPVERTPGRTTFRQKSDGIGAEDAAVPEEETTTDEESTTEDVENDALERADVVEISVELCTSDEAVGVGAADTAELMIESFTQLSPVKTPKSMTKSVGVFVMKSSVPNK
jgi:hypothetical protein